MSSDQLKALVIERVLYEQDESTLQNVLNLLSGQGPQTMVLTPEQRDSVEAGLADYAAGRFVTEEEMERQDAEWQ